VFEHPGLLEEDAGCTDEVCITCSDEGRVAEVRSVLSDGSALVIVSGRSETVDASLVDPVVPGDLLLVHAGVALTALGMTRP
jgi:hydrogenase maturation factor